MPTRTSVALLALGVAALAAGAAVYAFDRGPVALLPSRWTVASTRGALPAALSGWLPSLCHAYAFSLLTAAWLPPRRAALLLACGGWFAIDVLFEAGQHPALASTIAAALPHWFDAVPVLDQTGRYFLQGHFGWDDIAATAAGAGAAAWTLLRLQSDRSTRRPS